MAGASVFLWALLAFVGDGTPSKTTTELDNVKGVLEDRGDSSRLRIARPNAELFNIEIKPQLVLQVFNESQQQMALIILGVGLAAIAWRAGKK